MLVGMGKRLDMSEVAKLGGLARAKKLSPRRRRASARKAARARWAKAAAATAEK